MKFDLMTMIAVLGAFSLIFAASSNPYVVFGIVMFVLPISMMLIAVSSPKEGTSLNVTSRWYFFLLGKTWCFTVVFAVLAFVVISLFVGYMPGTSDRIGRMMRGDFRARVIYLQTELDGVGEEDFKPNPKPIYDERGVVGECRAHFHQLMFDNNTGRYYKAFYLKIHTDRNDLKDVEVYRLQRLKDGKLQLDGLKKPKP